MIKVIVADDHKIVREGLKQLISLAPDLTVVGEATNGQEVMERVKQLAADVLLLDISMPDCNGVELIPKVKALPTPPSILMLSMHNEAQIAARALKNGASGYTTKDSDPALLVAAIRKVAAGGRYIEPDLADRLVFEVGLSGDRPAHASLSERELQVFERLVKGAHLNDIAEQLVISAKTVSTHKVRLMQKLGVTSNAELVRYALQNQLFK
ncbi:response regulator transcription factor [Leeia sp. TBRC 13508]|uniref:Response regulator transcription factor n=1 Tax=Leeia speluncae TaxID=2884804 RepID=A0ABS8D4U2_9NEIS|nr:response regulator transcription factor [Leeia speluncae]MCB6183199.1 response regulator transcription factor [Leeia speluncae]